MPKFLRLMDNGNQTNLHRIGGTNFFHNTFEVFLSVGNKMLIVSDLIDVIDEPKPFVPTQHQVYTTISMVASSPNVYNIGGQFQKVQAIKDIRNKLPYGLAEAMNLINYCLDNGHIRIIKDKLQLTFP